MAAEEFKAYSAAGEAVREACHTFCGLPQTGDELGSRLQYVAELLSGAGRLPAKPLLLWRDAGGVIHHKEIGPELIVGRQSEGCGLALAQDELLSRRHFLIRAAGEENLVEDFRSRNGIAVNQSKNKVQQHILRDGDLIFAGKQVFVFLNQGKTS